MLIFEVMGREEYYWNMLGASVLFYEACQVDAIDLRHRDVEYYHGELAIHQRKQRLISILRC